MQCTVGILISVLSIFLTEAVAALVLTLILGSEQFNAIMDNTSTIEGQITRAIYGIPMNILFVIVALMIYFILDRRAKRIAAHAAEGQVEETEN
jgi:ABC-type sugar transport system permease subunit